MREHSVAVCLGLVWVFLCAIGIVRAEDSSEPSNLQEEYDKEIRRSGERDAPLVIMDPVVVTATRAPKQLTQVPGAVSVIDQKQILQGRPAVGVDETLRIVPGVQAERRFGPDDVRISIRGSGVRSTFGVRSVRILIDGIPLTEVDGQTRLEPIALDAVARVEVLRGPNSTLYGNASAGVINYVLEEGQKDNRYVEPRFVFGSYDFSKYRVKCQRQVQLDGELLVYGLRGIPRSVDDEEPTLSGQIQICPQRPLGPVPDRDLRPDGRRYPREPVPVAVRNRSARSAANVSRSPSVGVPGQHAVFGLQDISQR